MEQVVEGGSLLKSIVEMFFKGVDSLLDGASEYEEEMGILKQKTIIPLEDENGKSTPYTLTIKLAPVKGKTGRFYVEAETTAPGLDVSSIHGKVMDLGTNSKKKFLKMIDDVLSQKSLARDTDNAAASNSESTKEDAESEAESVTIDSDQEQEISDLIESAAKADGIEYRTAEMDDGHLVTIRTELEQRAASPSICDLTIFAEDPFEQKQIKSIKQKSVMVPAVNSKGETLSFESFCDAINAQIDDYLISNKLKEKEARSANSSSIVDATFVKSGNEVSFVAIKASCNIHAALDMISETATDESFISELPEDTEVSFRIEDDGETLNVNHIDEVDISSTYDVLFNAVSNLSSKLVSIRWAIGSEKWNECTPLCTAYWTASSLLDACAEWVVRHTDHYPCVQNCFGDFAEFTDYQQDGKISFDLVKQDILGTDVPELILLLDNYYVNLECDEQNAIAEAIGQLKRIITYST